MVEIDDFKNQLILGDCLDVMPQLPDCCVDSVVTDSPYGLGKIKDLEGLLRSWLSGETGLEYQTGGFMASKWDAIPSPLVWKEMFRVLKPGGIALVFAGTRTVDLMGLSLRLAGFEYKETIEWVYGSGFPKAQSLDRVREGWKTFALKPAHEPIICVQKPIAEKTIAANILKWGVGGLNISGCRVDGKRFPSNFLMSHCPECECLGEKRVKDARRSVETNDINRTFIFSEQSNSRGFRIRYNDPDGAESTSRYACLSYCPNAHTLVTEKLQPCPECGEEMTWACPVALLDEQTKDLGGSYRPNLKERPAKSQIGIFNSKTITSPAINGYDDKGGASRYFQRFPPESPFTYQTKASKSDRTMNGRVANTHPTVKGQNLLRFLARLVTPPNGVILDCFAGSGSTALAALSEGFNYILIEQDPEYCEIARQRIQCWHDDCKQEKLIELDIEKPSVPTDVKAIEKRVELLEKQVKANRRKIRKIEDGMVQLGLFDAS